MALNWDLIGTGDSEALLRPRDIYAGLASRPWPYLRHEQGEVLDKWFDQREQRDVVIKQNTGGGKTAVGLLIAQSTLNEGIGKAVYLTPDNYLVKQVREEATKLGVATTDDPHDPAFLTTQAVLVTNYQKLINGKSAFGVVGDSKEPVDLGIVVVDDAHAALARTEDQFRLRVPASHEAYAKLLELFAEDLQYQSANAWSELEDKDPTALAPIPFWAWADKNDEVLKILRPHRLERDFMFVWPLIAEVLHLCTATATSKAIEIRPSCTPIDRIPSFVRARRRVYLTATLADDSALVTDFGADAALVAEPVTPGSASDLGERMILAPVALNPGLAPEAMRVLARQFADGDRDGDGVADADPVNVVVLVPSDRAAAAWAPHAHRTFRVGDLEAGVQELQGGHVGLVVLVNKYDGVNLPDDACRLLILDGIPRPLDGVERREAVALADSTVRLAREIQRIEQGMGRGVRDRNDYCAVLLLGANLAVSIHDPRHLALFSPATRAQLKLSRAIASQLKGEGLDAVRQALRDCLGRVPQWTRRSSRALAEVRYAEHGTVRAEAVALREAFDLAATNRTRAAADRVQRAVNDLGDGDKALRGWLREQKAAYLHLTNRSDAQHALAGALDDNSFVLRPVDAAPVQIRAAVAQARAAAEFLAGQYSDGVSLRLSMQALFENVVWGEEERSDDAEQTWHKLGLHLGFVSSRPEKQYGTGPDNLWALSAARQAVTELKTGCGTGTAAIAKKDMDQLGGSVRWLNGHNPEVKALPVMLHPSRVSDDKATAPSGMRVVTPELFEKLKKAVMQYAAALTSSPGRWGDEQAVAEQLAHHKLTGDRFFDAYAEPVRAS
ncbi:DEAD/DEAH box helicase family protein [Streptomyces nigrescens]|uniref:DEAD/DEAH box helicase family protein n=1 Tax=Streptomyces nigrescens TaxID=1920 RepID=UPI0022585967|nr:DEAD/DEAH box helicase family protein [Streptomyces libani]MCX5450277.1 DEAD/DEAH box helicase family protein [Streptomyces libani]